MIEFLKKIKKEDNKNFVRFNNVNINCLKFEIILKSLLLIYKIKK
jgi:hypothetical protein